MKRYSEKGKMQNIPVISIDREIEGCFCFAFNYADAFENICRRITGEDVPFMELYRPSGLFSRVKHMFRRGREAVG